MGAERTPEQKRSFAKLLAVPVKSPRAYVWFFYNDLAEKDKDAVECKYCHEEFLRDSSIEKLSSHLFGYHWKEQDDYRREISRIDNEKLMEIPLEEPSHKIWNFWKDLSRMEYRSECIECSHCQKCKYRWTPISVLVAHMKSEHRYDYRHPQGCYKTPIFSDPPTPKWYLKLIGHWP